MILLKSQSEVKLLSRVRLFAIPQTVAYQAPQSMEFSRQEYWSGLPFPSPGDLPNPGIRYSLFSKDKIEDKEKKKVNCLRVLRTNGIMPIHIRSKLYSEL